MEVQDRHAERPAGGRHLQRHGQLQARGSSAQAARAVSTIAELYVKLVLAMGEHDADYVDAYYGPPEWREQAKGRTLADIRDEATTVLANVHGQGARAAYQNRQLQALVARIDILEGKMMTFDEESKALYDAVAPHLSEKHFRGLLADLDAALPGSGAVHERYEAYRQRFVIRREKLDAVFQKAIAACRARTLEHMALPDGESFTVEYVNNKSWSGYNWYQGGYRSLIQVNTDLPIFIDRAIDLACHEGYPGHHVYNALLEQHLVRDRGWVEFSVYALFSPQSLIAEGTANFGIDVAFPRDERIEIERRVIFPAAGLDDARAGEYLDVLALVDRLSYAGNEAARRYIDGEIDRDTAAEWLERYALYSS